MASRSWKLNILVIAAFWSTNRSARAINVNLQCRQESNCFYKKGCSCPLNFPNWPKVDQNPPIIMIAVQGNFTEDRLDTFTSLIDSISKISRPTCLNPSATLFMSYPLANESIVLHVLNRGYQIGCYIPANDMINASLDKWIERVSFTVKYLNSLIHIVNGTDFVKVCRSELSSGPDYYNFMAALSIVEIKIDWSYRTRQALYPFTMDYPDILCDEAAASAANIEPLCVGALPGQWIIPNNALLLNADESCFTLEECYEQLGRNWTSLSRVVLENFSHRLNTRRKYSGLWQARQPFIVNFGDDFLAAQGTFRLLNEMAGYIANEYQPKHTKETRSYFLTVSKMLSWSLHPLKITVLENEVDGYRLLQCSHKHSRFVTAFYAWTITVVTGFGLFCFVCLVVKAILLCTCRDQSISDGEEHLTLWKARGLLVDTCGIFIGFASINSFWLVGWIFTYFCSLSCWWCLTCEDEKEQCTEGFRRCPLVAGLLTTVLVCFSAFNLHNDDCTSHSGVIYGLLAVFFVFSFVYFILYDLIDFFFDLGYEDMTSVKQQLASTSRQSEESPEDDSTVNGGGTQTSDLKKSLPKFNFKLSWTNWVARFCLVFDITLNIALIKFLSNDYSISMFCNTWVTWRECIFIFSFHTCLRTVGIQTVKYVRYCELSLEFYEYLQTQLAKAKGEFVGKLQTAIQRMEDNCENSKRVKYAVTASLFLQFFCMPLLQSLYLSIMWDHWSDFDAPTKAMYLTTFLVTTLYAQVPFFVLAVMRSKVSEKFNPFHVPSNWTIPLTVLQSVITTVAAQIVTGTTL